MPNKKKDLTVSELEAQFKQVSDKLQEAADALKAANALSNKFGMGDIGEYERSYPEPLDMKEGDDERLDEMFYDQPYILLNEMDECGWRTSSLGC